MADKSKKFKQFEEDCQYNLDQQYKKWKTNRYGNATICIPEAVDVCDKVFIRTIDSEASDYGHVGVTKKQNTIDGFAAEAKVHSAFQRSTVGGILIQGSDFAKLFKKLKACGLSKEKVEKLQPMASGGKKGGSFEIDSLLLHPQFGIVILECKARDFESEGKKKGTNSGKVRNTLNQVRKTAKRLQTVYETLTDSSCDVQIQCLLCFPGVKKPSLDDLEEGQKSLILDEDDLSKPLSFHAFWQAFIANNAIEMETLNYFQIIGFCRFIAIFYGFQAAKFLSPSLNALEVNRMVAKQEGCQHLKFVKSTIFLNSEQLSVYNAAEIGKKLFIFGPPGSGKTILIQLLAIEAAKQSRPGKVLIILPYESLKKQYECFIKNSNDLDREILLKIGHESVNVDINGFDDIFADEAMDGSWIPDKVNPNRMIVVGITNDRFCRNSALLEIKTNLESKQNGSTCEVRTMKTVMRNTRNICNFYHQFTDKNDKQDNNRLILGHNILGKAVEEIRAKNLEQACELIVERIKQLLNAQFRSYDSADQKKFSYADIAIIVAHQPTKPQCEIIIEYLRRHGIPAGTIAEQSDMRLASLSDTTILDNDIVAVDNTANTLSFEWCFVFVLNASLCYHSAEIANPIIAYSRAVSCLTVIKTFDCDNGFWSFWKCGNFNDASFSAASYSDLSPTSVFSGVRYRYKYLSRIDRLGYCLITLAGWLRFWFFLLCPSLLDASESKIVLLVIGISLVPTVACFLSVFSPILIFPREILIHKLIVFSCAHILIFISAPIYILFNNYCQMLVIFLQLMNCSSIEAFMILWAKRNPDFVAVKNWILYFYIRFLIQYDLAAVVSCLIANLYSDVEIFRTIFFVSLSFYLAIKSLTRSYEFVISEAKTRFA